MNSIIGEGTTLKGDIESDGNLRVEGKIIGNTQCKSKIALGNTAIVEGNIHAVNAEISGKVSGKIVVSEVLILKPSAIVLGNIHTSNFIMEAGAIFTGNCKMEDSVTQVKLGNNIQLETEQNRKVKAA